MRGDHWSPQIRPRDEIGVERLGQGRRTWVLSSLPNMRFGGRAVNKVPGPSSRATNTMMRRRAA
jgi:hypothetical protein